MGIMVYFFLSVWTLRAIYVSCMLPASEKHPVGPKMCTEICSQISVYTQYMFSASRLACHLSYPRCSHMTVFQGGFSFNVTQAQNMTCKISERRILSSDGFVRCVTVTATLCTFIKYEDRTIDGRNLISMVTDMTSPMPPQPNASSSSLRNLATVSFSVRDEEKNYNNNLIPMISTMRTPMTSSTETCSSVLKSLVPRREDIISRLLVIPHSKNSAYKYHQLIFQSITLKEYRYINHYKVRAVAFISKLRKVLISHSNKGVIAYWLDKNKRKVFCRSLSYSMAVDEDDELVFISAFKSGVTTVLKFTTRGKGHSRIKTYEAAFVYAVALDQNHNRIYVALSRKLEQCTYNGKLIQVFSKKKIRLGLTVSPEADVYFAEGKSIFMLKKTRKSPNRLTLLATFGHKPKNIIHDGGLIHMSFENSGEFGTFDISQRKFICKFRTGYMKTSHLICLII